MSANSKSGTTPSVIRGESPSGEILIDTLSVTIPASAIRMVVGSVSTWTHSDDEMVEAFQKLTNYLFGTDLFECESLKGGRNFFDNSIPFRDNAGFFAFGGNNKVRDYEGEITKQVEERVQLYVTGEGCARIHDWQRLRTKLERLNARITRIDPAFDDHEGIYDINHCKALYKHGHFTSSGRPPKMTSIDDHGSGDGKTVYIGNRKNGKLLRCYEKGKQLGDKLSAWVRWELEIHAKDREIPLEILTDPIKYLAGAYPALEFLSNIRLVIKTSREKLSIQYDKLKNIARIQYGKLFNFAHQELGLDFEQLFYEFMNPDGYPDRLQWSRKTHYGVMSC